MREVIKMGNLIIGTGSYVPETVITNEDLLKYVDLKNFDEKRAKCSYPEWVEKVMGFKERRWASDNQATSDLAYEASVKALDSAGIEAKDIDLILVSSASADKKAPNTASILQKKLGVGSRSFAPELSAACPGFTWGMHMADAMLKHNSQYKYALVVAAEKMTSILDKRNYITGATFGDGAGAVVLMKPEKNYSLYGLINSYAMSDGERGDFLDIPAGGSHMPITPDNIDEIFEKGLFGLQMKAQETKKFAIKKLEEATRYVLRKEGLSVNDISYLLGHQASKPFIESAISPTSLNIPHKKVLMNLEKYANTSQASTALFLDENKKLYKNGDLLTIASMGGGLGWGAVLYRWFDYKSVPKKVIFVDDELGKAETHIDYIEERLLDEAYVSEIEFFTAKSGEEFVNMIKEVPTKYDVAIVDMIMPGMNGLDAILQAKQYQKDLRCGILTGKATQEQLATIGTYASQMGDPHFKVMWKPLQDPETKNYEMIKKMLNNP